MAEGGADKVEKTMEQLEREITCAICHEHYTEPKVLSCLHYYCMDCIQELALRNGADKPLSCPDCRTETTLPLSGGVASLKSAFFINRMKEVYSRLARALGKMETMCELCSEDKAAAFCRQCAKFVCTECMKQHKRMNTFSGHKTVSLQELRDGKAKEILYNENPLKTCAEHDEKMNIFCFDCNDLICRDCTIDDHCGHHREFIRKSAPKAKRELLEQLDLLKEVKAGLLCAADEMKASKWEVKAQIDTVTANIEDSFAELIHILTHRKQKLIADAKAKGVEKLDSLSVQEDKASTSYAMVQSMIEFSEQLIAHSADGEIMCTHAEIQSRIKNAIEEQKSGVGLHPSVEADIGVEVSFAEDLKDLCHKKAKLIKLPTEKRITCVGIQSATVDEQTEIVLLGDGNHVKERDYSIKCHLKSRMNGSTTKCNVTQNGSEYRITCRPTVRGHHEIQLSAPGYGPIHGPVPIFVTIHPTKLVKPVKVIIGPDELFCASVNSAGDVVASEVDNIIVFNREGVKVNYIMLLKEHNVSPIDLATDSDDNVFVTCDYGNLIRLNSRLMFLKKTTREDAKFRNISIVGEELFVCNCKDDTVLVYSVDLEFKRVITIHAPGGWVGFRYMATDCSGNVYACGSKTSIHVFTCTGQFVREFGGRELSAPRGVCLIGEYVYVADSDNSDLIVYTTAGEYTTSFKCHSECVFVRPFGVCADQDGFIYLCDSENVFKF